jgi:S-adenosylmethionine synthetase
MMYGYACNETEHMLPKAMVILQDFAHYYDLLRTYDDRFLPDGKAQITGIYDDDFKLVKIKDFTISYQNTEIDREETDSILKGAVIDICEKYGITEIERFLINPTGKFLIGGFEGDAGLTGRKIVVDAYQGFANVGGGCQNGKDATKVDFSASHMARKIACEYLKSHKLGWCEVQLSYAIGMAEPLAIYINSSVGYIEPEQSLYRRCTPANIIKELDLLNADYEEFAKFGHYTKADV